ncbi:MULTISPECIES: ABC transporter permease [unclassified Corynebacterium]|uniref:ABC transporter permease n=1 Tax=unclassified Corynebacterium TaxID=2624378 RepID=UPI0009F18142|nr:MULTISPECIES: ABC transporter permease [unclassified Corynebacterium]
MESFPTRINRLEDGMGKHRRKSLPQQDSSDDAFSSRKVTSRGDYTVHIDAGNLKVLDTRPPLLRYLRQLWGRREYIWAESTAGTLRVDKDFKLGRLWLIFQPLCDAAIYIIMFGLLLKTSRGIDNFIGFVTIGIVYFGFINRLLLLGSGLLRTQKNMIVSFKFPRAAVPLSKALSQGIECIPAACVAILVGLIAQWDHPVHWTLLLVPIAYIGIILFSTGLLLITARITAFLPDLKPLLALISRFWLYGSGVFYSIDTFINHPVLVTIMKANPAFVYLSAVRDLALYGNIPSVSSWIQMAAWSFGTLIFGILFFWQAEERYVRALQ